MPPLTPHQQRLLRRVVRVVSGALFTLLVTAVAAILVVLLVLPRATGGAALTVLTGSMTPGIPVGSVVVVRPVEPGSLRVGDVATYQVAPDSPSLVTHRVIRVDEGAGGTTYVFKGDANRGPDARPVPAAAVRGEVWFHVPWLGQLRDALRGGPLLSLLAVLGLLGYALTQLGSGLRDRRRRVRGHAPVADERTEAPEVARAGA